MAVAVIASSAITKNSASPTLNATKPSGTASGDILVAYVYATSGTGAIGLPAGWTSVQNSNGIDGELSCVVAWKLAGGSEPSTYAFTTAGDESRAILLRITGADTTTPVDVSAKGTGTTNTLTFPSATTTGADALVLLAGGTSLYGLGPSGSEWPNVVPASTTIAAKDEVVSGYGLVGGIAYFTQAVAGATGSKTVTMAEHYGTTYFAATVAIKAAGGGPTAYTLTGAAGSFTLSGQAATLKSARKVVADAASFALTGQAAGLYAGRKVGGAAGSFALTGQDAGLKAARKVTADAGAFVLTGQDAGLRAARKVVADAGAFTLTGQDAGLRADWRLTADAGTFDLSGQDAALVYVPNVAAYTLTAEAVAFDLTGIDAGLTVTAAPVTMGPGVASKRRSRRGKTWQQAFWDAPARELYEEIEAAAEQLPSRIVDRAESLIEAIEAEGPRASVDIGEPQRIALQRRSERKVAALRALAQEAARIMAAKAAEQDDEEALLLLYA